MFSLPNAAPLSQQTLESFYVTLFLFPLGYLIVFSILQNVPLTFFLALLGPLTLSKLCLITCLFSLQPVFEFLAEPILIVLKHLIVALLATNLPFIVFVFVGKGVINEYVLAVDGRHPSFPLRVVILALS